MPGPRTGQWYKANRIFNPPRVINIKKGDHTLKMTFEDQINALHKSARHLVQDRKKNIFAEESIAPDRGISRSSFSDAVNHRGLERLQFIFEDLYIQAAGCLPKEHAELGELVSIDGSLINAVLSMNWANYMYP